MTSLKTEIILLKNYCTIYCYQHLKQRKQRFELYLCRMWSKVAFMIRHEARMEMRQQHTLVGIALFSIATVYLAYQSFHTIEDGATWNALLCIILLFTAFSAVGKSFQEQRRGLRLYLFWNVSPKVLILAKLIYNTILMLLLTAITLFVYVVFIGSSPVPENGWPMLLLGLAVGSISFSALLTLISAIASQSESGTGMTAVLGLPIVIPQIILIHRYHANVLKEIPWGDNVENLLMLLVLTAGIFGLSYLLFPYLWRD